MQVNKNGSSEMPFGKFEGPGTAPELDSFCYSPPQVRRKRKVLPEVGKPAVVSSSPNRGRDLRALVKSSKRDWQEIGRELRDDWMAKTAHLMAVAPLLRKQIPGYNDYMDFENALLAYEEGDPSSLIDYLRSDRPLDRERRDSFAWYLDHLSKPKPTGRPCNYIVRDIADLRCNFIKYARLLAT